MQLGEGDGGGEIHDLETGGEKWRCPEFDRSADGGIQYKIAQKNWATGRTKNSKIVLSTQNLLEGQGGKGGGAIGKNWCPQLHQSSNVAR